MKKTNYNKHYSHEEDKLQQAYSHEEDKLQQALFT